MRCFVAQRPVLIWIDRRLARPISSRKTRAARRIDAVMTSTHTSLIVGGKRSPTPAEAGIGPSCILDPADRDKPRRSALPRLGRASGDLAAGAGRNVDE
jgi:hypothetical protein